MLLFVMSQAADMSKPVDKRIYKGTLPTCHDSNALTATAESVSLLVGFSAGQVQLIDPIKKETSKLFNEDVSPGRVCLRLNLNRFNLVQSVIRVVSSDRPILMFYNRYRLFACLCIR